MKSIWEYLKNEGNLFLKDLDTFADFLTQPVTFSSKKKAGLNPTFEEVEAKTNSGFWSREWSLFKQDWEDCKQDFRDLANFCTQPVDITWGNKNIL